MNEITEGVTLVSVLPPEFALKTTYSLAVCTAAKEPALSSELAQLLTSEESRDLRAQGGFV